MAGCSILISLASLTFLFSHISPLSSTLTLSLVLLWCSCAQCSHTPVRRILRLRWSFILVASFLSVSPMYVRGHTGHATLCTRPHYFMSVRCFFFGYTRMDQMVLINVQIASTHSICFEHTCECLRGALHAQQANINFRHG